MKNCGIWLDYKEAYIIFLENGESQVEHVLSEVSDSRMGGGSRSKTPWGPMDKTSESKHLEKRKKELKNYYQKLIHLVSDTDSVFIFGPAEAKTGLVNQIKGEKSSVNIAGMEPADSMTTNQIVARVRSFYQDS